MPPQPEPKTTLDALGTTLGRFRITREIATGGMATVYLGHRQELGGFTQLAAIKLMHPYLASNPKLVRMFLAEARILSNLHHPNVCRLLDFGRSDDAYYLAMELLHGETWADVLRALKRKRVPAPVLHALTAYVMAQACEGLHAAHVATDHAGTALSVVHRDVAPQNLHIGYDGSVRVLDFGVACAIEDGQRTESGVVQGRFAYMAPEQLRSEPSDARADVWSLGVVLWESLTGVRAFRRANESETILAVMDRALPPWPSGASAVPQALRAIVEQALSSDPAARQGSARELGAELTRFLNAEPVPLGMADLSDWMERLFSTRKAEQRKLISDAIADSQILPPPIEPNDDKALDLLELDVSLLELEQTMSPLRTPADDHSHKRLAVFVDSFAPAPLQSEPAPLDNPFGTGWSLGRYLAVGTLLLTTVAAASWLARAPGDGARGKNAASAQHSSTRVGAPVLDLELTDAPDAASGVPRPLARPADPPARAKHAPPGRRANKPLLSTNSKQAGKLVAAKPGSASKAASAKRAPSKAAALKTPLAKPAPNKSLATRPATAKPAPLKPAASKPKTSR